MSSTIQFEPDWSRLHPVTAEAIRNLRQEIKWKPGKDQQHVETRIRYGHLPAATVLSDYHAIIANILHQQTADVYLYVWTENAIYPTVVGDYNNQQWLVMFSLDSIMETAFPPTDAETYLANSRFHYLGTIEEILR